MKRLKNTMRCLVLSATLLTFSAPAAAADDIKNILQFLSDAKIIDQKIVDASELIRCFAEHSPAECVDLQQKFNDLKSDASSAAEKKAAEFVPDDPMISTAVDIVRAVIKKDWLRVLELAGVDLLGQVACEGALAVAGPLRPFVCGAFKDVVLKKAESVVHEILVVAKDFPNVNIWKMVTLFGFELACDIAEDEGVPLASEACGVLGAAVKAIKDLGEAAASLLLAGADAVNDAVTAVMGGGGGNNVSAEQLYNMSYRPLMYKHALQRIVENRQNLGFDAKENADCLKGAATLCGVFDKQLRDESEALVKLVQAMPATYVNAFLMDDVRKRAVDRFGQGNTLLQYVKKLPIADWAELFDGQGISLMAAYTGIHIGDQLFFRDLWRECGFWVAEQLTGDRKVWVPSYTNIHPGSLTNWICYQGAAKSFLEAQVKEEQRLAKIRQGLIKSGCPLMPGKFFLLNCQSYAAQGTCLNVARVEFAGRSMCALDKPQAGLRLGLDLVGALTAERCVYLDKDKSGKSNPRVACSRPWKRETCEALLQSYRVRWGIEGATIRMQCDYYPDKEFLAQAARAKEILAVLNNGPVPGMARASGRQNIAIMSDPNSCKTLWDPLAINCPHQTKMPALTGDLASPQIESCPPDPNKNGADLVCYQTVFTAADSNKEIYENQTLSPISAPPPSVAPSPARTGAVIRQPVPSPIATTGSATALPGSASMPEMTTMSGSSPGQVDTGAAPAQTAAPAIRAINAQQDNPQAPPNPCSMDVTYYVPKAPVIETSSPSLQVSHQIQVQCEFEKRTRRLEWPKCDDEARNTMRSLKFGQESGSRYSGMMIIDDANIGIASSPLDGASFVNTGTWTFYEAGAHEITCQVDNGLHVAGSGSPVYLQAGASVRVGVQSGPEKFRSFEPASARRVPTTLRPVQTAPIGRDGRMRLSDEALQNPDNDEPATRSEQNLRQRPDNNERN